MKTINHSIKFKQQFTFEQRKDESKRMLLMYPDKIPIICEKYRYSKIKDIDKIKYLVPADLTVGQFIYVIRKRLLISAESSIFLTVNGSIPSSSSLINTLYYNHKDKDGFLYMQYGGENTFGLS